MRYILPGRSKSGVVADDFLTLCAAIDGDERLSTLRDNLCAVRPELELAKLELAGRIREPHPLTDLLITAIADVFRR